MAAVAAGIDSRLAADRQAAFDGLGDLGARAGVCQGCGTEIPQGLAALVDILEILLAGTADLYSIIAFSRLGHLSISNGPSFKDSDQVIIVEPPTI